MSDAVPAVTPLAGGLFPRVAAVIDEGRRVAAARANSALTFTNWHVGRLINSEVLHDERADHGKQIVASLSQQLTEHFGRGLSGQASRPGLRGGEPPGQPSWRGVRPGSQSN
ncbi:MAG: DUF1016 N-terminal domain-containing protein [Bifidobacteriaceae bacterium]|nr:DUF1016 N-terminal domain-containing protein [Bifidobacteriaceae bacterium]